MSGMFAGLYQFNQDIGGWDTRNVTDMSGMFSASAFNQDIGGWNTRNVTDMSRHVLGIGVQPGHRRLGHPQRHRHERGCSGERLVQPGHRRLGHQQRHQHEEDVLESVSFNQDIGGWNVSNVTIMVKMFYGACAFNQDIGEWKVGKVTDMEGMLTGAGLSTSNYDRLLVGWAGLRSLHKAVELGAKGIHYSGAARAARQTLIDTYGWVVSDAGMQRTTVIAQPTAKNSKLKIRIKPNLGSKKQWKFTVKKRVNGQWRTLTRKNGTVKVYKTRRPKHIRVLNLKKGRYKARSRTARGYQYDYSKVVKLLR